MKTLDELDDSIAAVLDDAPDGRERLRRRRRHRRRIMAACVSMMPPNPTDDFEEMAEWRTRAQAKCGSVILMIIAAAVLSWMIQKLCDWLYERWKERHAENAEWSALRTEACLLLQQENDD